MWRVPLTFYSPKNSIVHVTWNLPVVEVHVYLMYVIASAVEHLCGMVTWQVVLENQPQLHSCTHTPGRNTYKGFCEPNLILLFIHSLAPHRPPVIFGFSLCGAYPQQPHRTRVCVSAECVSVGADITVWASWEEWEAGLWHHAAMLGDSTSCVCEGI